MSQNTMESSKTGRYLKYGNVFFVAVFLFAVLVKVILFSSESSISLRIFTSIMLSLFMAPYLLCIRALSPNRKKNTAIIISIVWCIFIVVGVTAMQQGYFVNVVCALLLVISIINIVFLVKMKRLENRIPEKIEV